MASKRKTKGTMSTNLEGLENVSVADLLRLLSAKTPPAEKKTPPVEKKVDWHKRIHKCPKCGHTGPVDTDFGTRVVRGIERLQSWCMKCRAGTSYYDKPRKNQTRTP